MLSDEGDKHQVAKVRRLSPNSPIMKFSTVADHAIIRLRGRIITRSLNGGWNMDPVATSFEPGGLELGLLAIGGILSFVSLVCAIMVIVKMFQKEQTALGIVSLILLFCSGIGYLITLVYGWMKSTEWNIKKLMVTYTVCFISSAVSCQYWCRDHAPQDVEGEQEIDQQDDEDMPAEVDFNFDNAQPVEVTE